MSRRKKKHTETTRSEAKGKLERNEEKNERKQKLVKNLNEHIYCV